MKIGELNLPARFAAKEHFRTAFTAAHRAADKLNERDVKATDDLTEAEVKEINRLLSEASCAARALENIMVGNPLPRHGD